MSKPFRFRDGEHTKSCNCCLINNLEGLIMDYDTLDDVDAKLINIMDGILGQLIEDYNDVVRCPCGNGKTYIDCLKKTSRLNIVDIKFIDHVISKWFPMNLILSDDYNKETDSVVTIRKQQKARRIIMMRRENFKKVYLEFLNSTDSFLGSFIDYIELCDKLKDVVILIEDIKKFLKVNKCSKIEIRSLLERLDDLYENVICVLREKRIIINKVSKESQHFRDKIFGEGDTDKGMLFNI